jgi:hypothetical protein
MKQTNMTRRPEIPQDCSRHGPNIKCTRGLQTIGPGVVNPLLSSSEPQVLCISSDSKPGCQRPSPRMTPWLEPGYEGQPLFGLKMGKAADLEPIPR